MKKVLVLVAIMLGLGNVAKSNEVSIIDRIDASEVSKVLEIKENGKDYKFLADRERLGSEIGLSDSVKLDMVYKAYDKFCKKMGAAEYEPDDKKRLSIIFKNIDRTLSGVRPQLDKRQYRNFLSGFNKELNGHGFSEESYLYCTENSK